MRARRAEGRRGPTAAGAWAAGALLLYAILFFAPATLQGRQFYFRDVSQNHYPMRCFEFPEACAGSAAPAVAGGRTLAVWNPHLTFGQPSLANPNYMVFHPTTLPFFALPFDAAFRWGIVLQYLVAALGTYALLRDVGAGRPAAWLGGVAFAFSGPVVSLGNLYNVLGTVAWLPLGAFLARRAVAGRGPWWTVAAAAVMAVEIVAGEPLMVVGSVALTCLLALRQPTARPRLRRAGALALVIALAGGMAAAQILPTLELLPHSERGAGFLHEATLRWSMHPLRALELLIPGWFGDPTDRIGDAWWGEGFFESTMPLLLGVYLGGPVLLLAAVGAGTLRRDPFARDLTLAGIACLLLALGRHAGLFGLLRVLPGFDAVRYPSKFLLLLAFCVACLAALGLERLRAAPAPRALGLAGGVLVLLPAVLGAALWIAPAAGAALLHGPMAAGGAPGGPRDAVVLPRMAGASLRAAGLTGGALLLGLALAAGWTRPGIPVLALAALVAADLYGANGHLNPTVGRGWYRQQPPFLAAMRRVDPDGRIYRHRRPEGFALRIEEGTQAAEAGFLWDRLSLRNVTGLQYGVNFAFDRNNEGLNPGPSAFVARRLQDYSLQEKVRTWRLGAARFVLSYAPLDHRDLRLIDALPGRATHPALLYELRAPLPRARVVGRVEREDRLETALQRMRSAGFDAATTLLLPGSPGQGEGEARRGAAAIVRDDPDRVEVVTRADFAGFLVLADTYFPGWHAEVDGAPAAIEAAYLLFRAVRVPAGEHRVTFRYEPLPLRAGIGISLATLLGSVGGAVLAGLRRRRRAAA